MTFKEPIGAAAERAKIARKRKRRLDDRHAASVRRMEAKDRKINGWKYKPRSAWTPKDWKAYNYYQARKSQ